MQMRPYIAFYMQTDSLEMQLPKYIRITYCEDFDADELSAVNHLPQFNGLPTIFEGMVCTYESAISAPVNAFSHVVALLYGHTGPECQTNCWRCWCFLSIMLETVLIDVLRK